MWCHLLHKSECKCNSVWRLLHWTQTLWHSILVQVSLVLLQYPIRFLRVSCMCECTQPVAVYSCDEFISVLWSFQGAQSLFTSSPNKGKATLSSLAAMLQNKKPCMTERCCNFTLMLFKEKHRETSCLFCVVWSISCWAPYCLCNDEYSKGTWIQWRNLLLPCALE